LFFLKPIAHNPEGGRTECAYTGLTSNPVRTRGLEDELKSSTEE
jgi:hypothetical protein